MNSKKSNIYLFLKAHFFNLALEAHTPLALLLRTKVEVNSFTLKFAHWFCTGVWAFLRLHRISYQSKCSWFMSWDFIHKQLAGSSVEGGTAVGKKPGAKSTCLSYLSKHALALKTCIQILREHRMVLCYLMMYEVLRTA